MLSAEQKNEIINWVSTACDIAEIDAPTIAFDLKGQTAGWYIPSMKKVRLNVDIFSRYWNSDLQGVKDVVLHELAHAMDHQRNGERKSSNGKHIHHDELFRQYMREIGGVDTSTTHNFKTIAVRKQRRWEYKCSCRTWKISTVIHNRIQKGQIRKCGDCGDRITKDNWSGKQI